MNALIAHEFLPCGLANLEDYNVWVYRPNKNNPYEFIKLAIPVNDDRFELTGGYFGNKAEVRLKEDIQ